MPRDDQDMEDAQPQRLKSAVTAVVKKKGRGFRDEEDHDMKYRDVKWETIGNVGGSGPAQSVEGWVVFVTGVHEEAQEEDIQDAFAECGDIKNIYLNLDRQTGFVKGYALVEYAKQKEAQKAIDTLNNSELLTQQISVDWAFKQGALKRGGASGGSRRR